MSRGIDITTKPQLIGGTVRSDVIAVDIRRKRSQQDASYSNWQCILGEVFVNQGKPLLPLSECGSRR